MTGAGPEGRGASVWKKPHHILLITINYCLAVTGAGPEGRGASVRKNPSYFINNYKLLFSSVWSRTRRTRGFCVEKTHPILLITINYCSAMQQNRIV